MLSVLNRFVEAHDRYLALDRARTICETPQQRELMHIELLRAYLEVQFRARQVAGIQHAEGNEYASSN